MEKVMRNLNLFMCVVSFLTLIVAILFAFDGHSFPEIAIVSFLFVIYSFCNAMSIDND